MILDYGDIKKRVLVDSREGEQIRESSNEENILETKGYGGASRMQTVFGRISTDTQEAKTNT